MVKIETRAVIGDDRVLRAQMPAGTPTGEMNVTITLNSDRESISPADRRTAAWAGFGSLRHLGGSVEEFLAERRVDDARRDKALGL